MNLKRINKAGLTSLLIIAALALGDCAKEAQVVTLDLVVKELVCEDGQRIFEGRVLELQGITAVTVNIDMHTAMIKFRDNQTSQGQIVDHLLEYGFTVNDTQGNQAAHSRLPSCAREIAGSS